MKFDRFTGALLPDDAVGENIVSELFREGQELESGMSIIDGGFAMGEDLQLFSDSENAYGSEDTEVVTSTGKKKVIPRDATFGSLSSGGLY